MTTMRLLHYSENPIEAVYSVEQKPRHGGTFSTYDKPRGLWLSVEGEDDWRHWCESESFGDPAAQLCYEVTLKPGANVLRIRNTGGLLAFTDDYGEHRGEWFNRGGIRWDRVAERYAGIIIAPYVWECRLNDETGWYYGWDCASGCVWDAAAVAGVALVSEPDAPDLTAPTLPHDAPEPER